MTREIEDLIRTVQEIQADRAAPADRIRAALPGRAAVARRRRYGLVGATVVAAAVAAAVSVPVLALRGGGPATSTVTGASTAPTPAGPTPSPTVAAALPTALALGFRPTWTPPGLGERIRMTDLGEPADEAGPAVVRVWKRHVGTGDPWSSDRGEIDFYVRTRATDAGLNARFTALMRA